MHPGFQHAICEDTSGPGGYTSYRRYCKGLSLKEMLAVDKGNPLFFNTGDNAEELFLRFASNLTKKVRHLHQDHNYVHRDIKPENVLIDDYSDVSLIDLGIALPVNAKSDGDGTRNWAAPEQLRPGTPVDFSHDMYSLGKLLLWALQLEVDTKNNKPEPVPRPNFSFPKWTEKNKAAKNAISLCVDCVTKRDHQRPTINELQQAFQSALRAGNRKTKIYDECPTCGASTLVNSPVCYSCLTPIIYEPPSSICGICGREIPTKEMKKHYRMAHQNEVQHKKIFDCPICRWSTTDEDLWKEHQRLCSRQDPILNPPELKLVEKYGYKPVESQRENARSLLAFSQAGLRFETLEVYRSLNIRPYDHQEDTVLRALRDLGGRCIIADSVGLGKTIECGIILRELLYRDLIESVLIIVPNYELQYQWLAELEDKFELGPNDQYGFRAWEHYDSPPQPGDRVITDVYHALTARSISDVTRNRIKTKDMVHYRSRKGVSSKRDLGTVDLFLNDLIHWDVIIVDEAHELGMKSYGKKWQRLYKMDPKYVFLVTATPMRRNPVDLYPLIRAIDPHLAGKPEDFERDYGNDETSIQDYRRLKALLSQVMVRHTRNDVHSYSFPRRRALVVFADLGHDLTTVYKNLQFLVKHPNSDLKGLAHKFYKLFMSGMYRFARYIQDFKLNSSGREDRERMDTLMREKGNIKYAGAWKAILSATRNTKLIKDQIDPKLEYLFQVIDTYRGKRKVGLGLDSEFSKTIQGSPIIVFSGSNDSRDKYREALVQKYEKEQTVEGFKSNMNGPERRAMLERFNTGQIDILVCGNSQSRGLNLQYGNILINMDLPSSPVEIEQRIGRVERLTQKKNFVFIINVLYNTDEEQFRWKCYKDHLMMFQEVLGDVDLVNLFTAAEVIDKVDDLNKAIVEGLRKHEDIEEEFKNLNQLMKSIKDTQEKALRSEGEDEDLF